METTCKLDYFLKQTDVADNRNGALPATVISDAAVVRFQFMLG